MLIKNKNELVAQSLKVFFRGIFKNLYELILSRFPIKLKLLYYLITKYQDIITIYTNNNVHEFIYRLYL
jgi:hypothetical protein